MNEEESDGRESLRTVADFFDSAEALREVFDERFQDPRAIHLDRFVWDYWHVPDQFTYLRTYADRYFPSSLYGRFLGRLRSFGQEELGCGRFSPIWLSCYVEGCVQELHVDAYHGPWSFVFSLTRWDARRFTGGETLLVEDDGSERRIPSRFNQLLAFDPCIPHGVSRVAGTWDPREARVVLHGWFKEPVLRCEGGLSLLRCGQQLERAWPDLARSLQEFPGIEGLAVVRAHVDQAGAVEHVEVIVNLLRPLERRSHGRRALDRVCQFLRTTTFADVSERARITLPIRFPISPDFRRGGA